MLQRIVFIMIVLQGVLLSSTVESVKIDGVEVPIIIEMDKTLPIVSMQVVFQNSGSIEDRALPGIAKFTAKMLNEGTKSLGAVGFATALEDKAIHLAVHSGTETFVIELSALKEQFPAAIKLLKSLLQEPNITNESFQKVKILMEAAIQRNMSNFDYIASVNLKKLLYHDTPIENPSSGTMESIKKISLEDVKAFIKKHLILEQTLIVTGGELSIKEAQSYAKEILSTLPKGSAIPLATFKAAADAKEMEVYKDTQQAFIYFGAPYHLLAKDEEVYKAKVAAFILGAGGFGSRLMEEVRVKRGLAYSAYARINFAKSHSDFSGYLQTKLSSQKEAIKLVKEIIANFVKNGVTSDELAQAKKFLLGSEPLRNETLSQRLSRAFKEYYNGFKLGHAKEELKKIEALTLEELNDFIKQHDEINKLSFSIVTKK
jgi:predicted Zn-dependent peptidase